MSFLIRQLDPQTTIGAELHTLRRRMVRTLEEASRATKIQKRYLSAMEADRWHDLPEPLYTRNFLRSYVQFLGEDVSYFLSRFEKERACCDLLAPSQTPRQRVRRERFLVTSRILKLGFLALIGMTVLGYFGFQVRSILEPPTLVVLAPEDGSTTANPLISVSGQIKEESQIRVNGESVLPSLDGTFTVEISLERGLNIITVEGKKRYSRPATVYRTVLFDPLPPTGSKLSLE